VASVGVIRRAKRSLLIASAFAPSSSAQARLTSAVKAASSTAAPVSAATEVISAC